MQLFMALQNSELGHDAPINFYFMEGSVTPKLKDPVPCLPPRTV